MVARPAWKLVIGSIALVAGAREATAEELAGELGAALGPAFHDDRLVYGGEVRGGLYHVDRDLSLWLIGNRVGFDVRLRALYGESARENAVAHFLIGAAPSFTAQFGGLYRRSRGFRVPSFVGLALPEPGLWVQSAAPALFYLGWRAPVAWHPGGDAGLELAPSFVWAPAGEWLAQATLGGFLR